MPARRSRGGRPRKVTSGLDQGTPELRARKLALVGGAEAGADPSLSEYPLGRMLALDLVTIEEHRCAAIYAYLYRRATGYLPPAATKFQDALPGLSIRRALPGLDRDGPDHERVAIQRRFRHAKNRLLAGGRAVCDATENLIVFQMTPSFLTNVQTGRRLPPSLQRSAELRAIRNGLAILSACFGIAAERTGRMETHRYASLDPTAQQPVKRRGETG
ncbi:MAG: hypothetical protein WD715_00365 [Dongiaceae bacterium]